MTLVIVTNKQCGKAFARLEIDRNPIRLAVFFIISIIDSTSLIHFVLAEYVYVVDKILLDSKSSTK